MSEQSSDELEYDHFTPCPGCGTIGFTVQVWVGGVQMMDCDDDDCRVHEYEPRPLNAETEQ